MEPELKARPIPEFDPGGRKAAARAKAEREALMNKQPTAAPVEAPPVEATPVEAPPITDTTPVGRSPAPVGPRWAPGYGPLDLPERTVQHLRDVTHELLLTLDSAIEAPHGAELVGLLEHARGLLVRAVATQELRKDMAAAAEHEPSSSAASTEAAAAEAETPAASTETPAPPKAGKK